MNARLPAAVQYLMHQLYDVAVGDVAAFLVTDAEQARRLGEHRGDEALLLRQREDELHLSLYLDAGLLARLAERDPLRWLDDANLADFLLVVEGVSHFVYTAFNAGHDRPVRLLELELQAEVDKYLLALHLLRRQGQGTLAQALHTGIFDRCRFRDGLDRQSLRRYRDANRYAGKYCRALHGRLRRRVRRVGLVRELRRFYRLPQQSKLRHIDAAFAAAG